MDSSRLFAPHGMVEKRVMKPKRGKVVRSDRNPEGGSHDPKSHKERSMPHGRRPTSPSVPDAGERSVVQAQPPGNLSGEPFVSDQTLRLAFDNAPTGMAVIDSDYRFHRVNSSFCMALGYSEAELLKKSFVDVTYADDVKKYLQFAGQLFRGEIPSYRIKKRIVTGTGSIVWLDHKALLVPNVGDTPRYALVMMENITDIERAKEALQEDEAMFRLVAETTPIGFYVHTNERFVYVNPATEAITGYSHDELLKMKVWEPVHPAMREMARQRARARIRGEDPPNPFEFMILRKSGDVRWAYTIANRIKFRGADSIFGTLFDITERKRAEAALKAGEDRYRSFVANSSEGIWRYETDQPIDTSLPINVQIERIFKHAYLAECNDAMARMYGYANASELIGKRMSDLLLTSEPSNIAAAHAFIESGYQLHDRESIEVDVHGETKYFANSLVGIIENGFLVRAWGTQRDETDQKKAEIELKSSREQLRDLAAHLQTIREKERTRIARDLHDVLGQALTSLKIDVAWLAKKLPDADKELVRGEMAERLLAATVLLNQTLGSVRTLSAELRPGLLDAFGLSAAVEWQCKEFEERTGITMECKVPEQELDLDADRATAIYRILQESLTNVARHSRASKVIVVLTATDVQVTLSIKDNGCGITEEELSARQSLGLVGMHERALMFNGELTIEGKPGIGTTVTARMPLLSSKSEPPK